MKKRICNKCGKEKESLGGKICENDHFVCKSCINHSSFWSQLKHCPLCRKRLR